MKRIKFLILIGLEHTAILGSTLAAIAAGKSGILKPGCRAVLYGQSLSLIHI